MKNIVLIFPGRRKSIVRLPLPVLYIAASLLKNKFNVRILDSRVENYKKFDFNNCFCVGISTWSGVMIKYALKIAKFIRKNYPNVKIVWGGIHSSLLPEQTLQNKYVDFVVISEGEESFVELVKKISNNENVSSVKGIAYKEGSKISVNPKRDFLNMNYLGHLPYDLLKLDKYPMNEMFTYFSSRGCPHDCIFCYNQKFNRLKWRTMDVKKILDDLGIIFKKFNPESIYFSDDNFFVDKKRVEELCHGFKKRNFKFKWHSNCRADYFKNFDIGFLNLLKECGLISLGIGAESGSEKILKSINKGITSEDIMNASEKCKVVGIRPIFSFMCGFPDETEEDFNKTLELISKIWKTNPDADVNALMLVTCYPGTPLYDIATKYGLKYPSNLEGWNNWQFGYNVSLPWIKNSLKSKMKTASAIVRFFHFRKQIEFYSKQHKKTKFNKGIVINFYKIFADPIFGLFAEFRWKKRWFGIPIEWRIWAFFRDLYVGFH